MRLLNAPSISSPRWRFIKNADSVIVRRWTERPGYVMQTILSAILGRTSIESQTALSVSPLRAREKSGQISRG